MERISFGASPFKSRHMCQMYILFLCHVLTLQHIFLIRKGEHPFSCFFYMHGCFSSVVMWSYSKIVGNEKWRETDVTQNTKQKNKRAGRVKRWGEDPFLVQCTELAMCYIVLPDPSAAAQVFY